MQRTNSLVEKSVPYKKRTLRSTTKSEIINVTNKAKKIDNYISVTDASIAKDTYSVDEEDENSDDTIKPNRQNKRNKTKEDQSKDVNMQESSHPISLEQDVPEVSVNETLQILHKETSNPNPPIQQTLNDSIHSPNNNTTSPPNNEGQSHDQGKIPNATNKETQDQQQTNPNKDTIMLDTNDDFTSYGGQANHTVFTFLNSFKTYDNNLEGVINLIRTYFHSNDSFIGVSARPIVIGQIPLIILRFNNKSYADALHNTFNDTLKVTFYKFDEETVNKEITKYLEKIDKRTIKLVDIEVNFPTDTIIEVFQKAYGLIEKVQEIFKRPFTRQPLNATPNRNPNSARNHQQRRNNNKPTKKQILLTFKNQSSADNIFGNDIWYKTIDHINIRILSTNQTSEEYIKRTECSYKITGIPLNATSQDLKPLFTKIGASSCSFTTPPRRQSFKIAYTYAPKAKFINTYTKFNVFNTTIYVFPSSHNKSCTICGNPSHQYQSCDQRADNNTTPSRSFKKSLINRNTNTKISLNTDITKKFKHLLNGNFTTFHRNTPSKQQFLPPLIPHIKSNNFATKQPSISMNNWDNPIDEIKSEITALKSSLKDAHSKINTLEQENKNLKNQLARLQTDILNNHKVTIAIKEQNSRVEIKQDQILEQLNSLFQQLGGTEQDYESNMDDMSDNASQSNYEYSDETHIK
ncbi:hypothetical protein RclHR1_02310012 [Rhizophagus clarus]|uniref:Uncharacterized protein n=1 Tax=Rhizophagus clarus TaxID=94130 RepID=A0A2Z6RPM5_9GLOM|nr:hypothetical protein RclHR1_02310012 [Rhizophagus clarus]GES73352.1 hypothetical protein GLOIN_2v1471680 [Rhizophagus clarus]